MEESKLIDVVFDIETDSLTPTLIWIIVCKDVDTGKLYKFVRPDLNPQPFLEFSQNVRTWIGHNVLGFDIPTLTRFGCWLQDRLPRIIDSLIVSRTLNYPIVGGHSLDAWAGRLGKKKVFVDDFSIDDPELLDRRCTEDVEINTVLYKHFLRWINSDQWKEAIRAEHAIFEVCQKLQDTGFYFDKEGADALYQELCKRESDLRNELTTAFPPERKLVREFTPVANKDGSLNRKDFRWVKPDSNGVVDLTPYRVGVPVQIYEEVEFNPGSPKQVVARLNEVGWEPVERTKGYIDAKKDRDKDKQERLEDLAWKVNEANLETLPTDAPEAASKLVQWLLINNRKSRLEEWFEAYNPDTNRIHGRFLHIGAWTHRMAHQHPNMGNVPSVDSKYKGEILRAIAKQYGIRLRSLWKASPGKVLIGVDADGIQLRILAHYMQDAAFTEALTNGSSANGTDAHTLNAIKLGFTTDTATYRARAKTFIYAWLLGAGLGKVASILGVSLSEARDRVESFIDSYPGLRELKDKRIPRDVDHGYFVGFDGRLVPCKSDHLMLAGYLQNGESTIMKHATLEWMDQADSAKFDYALVNFVHDEWDTETEDELAEQLGAYQMDSIKYVGEKFKLNCPFKGNMKKGNNWYDVH